MLVAASLGAGVALAVSLASAISGWHALIGSVGTARQLDALIFAVV